MFKVVVAVFDDATDEELVSLTVELDSKEGIDEFVENFEEHYAKNYNGELN